MGLFDFFRRGTDGGAGFSGAQPAAVTAPVSGTIVPMEEIPDAAFAQGAMGFCCGIVPESGEITSPLTGSVMQVADTFHALGLRGENGVQIILHIGIDTVTLRGDGFHMKVREGNPVREGQTLLTADMEKIKAAGYSNLIIVAVLNSDEYASAELVNSGRVERGDELIRLR